MQVAGAFAAFVHDHRFAADDDDHEVTWMTDHIAYAPPLGPLGWLADQLVLRRYLTRLITTRRPGHSRGGRAPMTTPVLMMLAALLACERSRPETPGVDEISAAFPEASAQALELPQTTAHRHPGEPLQRIVVDRQGKQAGALQPATSPRPELMLLVDRRAPAAALMSTLHAAAEAGHREVLLAAVREGDEPKALLVHTVPFPFSEPPPLELIVEASAQGLRVRGAERVFDEETPAILPCCTAGDLAALRSLLGRIKDEYPDVEEARLRPHRDIEHGTVVALLDALREDPGDMGDDGKPRLLFPYPILRDALGEE